MERLLKLTNKTIELSKINFLGFSSSKNWIGYFELIKDGENDRVTACNHALRLVYSYFINNYLNLQGQTQIPIYFCFYCLN